MHKALGSSARISSRPAGLSACSPELGRGKQDDQGVQDSHPLLSEFKASLLYLRPCLEQAAVTGKLAQCEKALPVKPMSELDPWETLGIWREPILANCSLSL